MKGIETHRNAGKLENLPTGSKNQNALMKGIETR
jgi:hypothetical protein